MPKTKDVEIANVVKSGLGSMKQKLMVSCRIEGAIKEVQGLEATSFVDMSYFVCWKKANQFYLILLACTFPNLYVFYVCKILGFF